MGAAASNECHHLNREHPRRLCLRSAAYGAAAARWGGPPIHWWADFATLYSRVDIAMYRAKAEGRNRFRIFTAEMQALSVRSLQLETDLRRALELGQLELHYQPQLSLASGAVIGAEALLRWRHPDLGMVPPQEFISVAEDSGQIMEIGEWVMDTAARQLKQWQQRELTLPNVSVNLSAIQFRECPSG